MIISVNILIKFEIPELDDKGKLICSIKIYSQSYRFDRSINPDENVNENLILAKVEKKNSFIMILLLMKEFLMK